MVKSPKRIANIARKIYSRIFIKLPFFNYFLEDVDLNFALSKLIWILRKV